MTKLYVLNYHEVQIAGYRIFVSFEEGLKEYLKHCILETRELLKEDAASEALSDSASDLSESDSGSKSGGAEEEFDSMSCALEVLELQDHEYVTTKEWDYEAFQAIIEEKEDIAAYLDSLEQQLEGAIPDELKSLFSDA